jgi:nicotinate-nucleotide pyrophosphorylase (carboxylating)
VDQQVMRIIRLALEEDIGSGDITTRVTVTEGLRAAGQLLAKDEGVISGIEVAGAVFREVDPRIAYQPLVADGERVERGAILGEVSGPARGILTAERTALNILQHLSGVATLTARYVEAIQGTRARIIDTRKTGPGLRLLEKAAVRHGGGHNHRFGLSDGVLIKDNHLAAIGGPDRIARAIAAARGQAPHTLRIEVEVTSVDELEQVLAAGADVVLLDNMSITALREAVERTAGRAVLEASGGVTLEAVRAIAETGVDLISVGALTHSAPALDISLEVELARD